MAYLGNSPGVASQRVETALTATASQTVFTPSSGYTLGYCDVYQNGVKLVNGDDYTAANGTTITLTTGAASGDSIVIVASFPRGLSDGYLKTEADAKYLTIASPSYTGTLTGGTGVVNLGSGQFYKDAAGNVGIGIAPIDAQGNLQVYKNVTGGGPATSGTTDANQVFAVKPSSVQTSFGAYVNGTGWIQQRATGNFATNYDLALQPNGGSVGIGTGTPNMNSNGTVLHIHNSTASRGSLIHMTNAETGAGAGDGLIVGKWSDGTNYFFDYDNSSIVFGTNGTNRAVIDTSGNLGISNGNLVISTAGKGIDFAASSNASGAQSELLDDYERGTWTCSSGSSGFTCSGTGYYVKIGRMVWASVYLQQTSAAASGTTVAVMGLPYVSDGYHSVNGGYYANGISGFGGGYTESGSAYLLTNSSYLTGSNVGMMLAVVYQATS